MGPDPEQREAEREQEGSRRCRREQSVGQERAEVVPAGEQSSRRRQVFDHMDNPVLDIVAMGGICRD